MVPIVDVDVDMDVDVDVDVDVDMWCLLLMWTELTQVEQLSVRSYYSSLTFTEFAVFADVHLVPVG